MKVNYRFLREFIKIAIPVALQSLLQSSFSVIDQIMTGQLGEASIAGIGIAGKFASLYSVMLASIASVAGIMIAQSIGKKDNKEIGRSFYLNLCLSFGLAIVFLVLCVLFPQQVMGLYTTDGSTSALAAQYLEIIALGFVPTAGCVLLATLFRCMNHASIPLYATVLNATLNTGLNYVLIFGKLGFPKMGVVGAALATVVAQAAGFFVMVVLFVRLSGKENWKLPFVVRLTREGWKLFGGILAPILICELGWSLGENVYASIYGHIGTGACAAMTLTGPMQVLFMGAMGGIAQAAGILTGKCLGAGDFKQAYENAKKMMWYGVVGSLLLSLLLITGGQYYVRLFQVEEQVREIARQLLVVFAVFAPVKVQNLILGGGIIRSGGKTKYLMYIDLIGTWGFGVPLGLLGAFVFHLPIAAVYFLLSLEECVRMGMSLWIFRGKKWMVRVDAAA